MLIWKLLSRWLVRWRITYVVYNQRYSFYLYLKYIYFTHIYLAFCANKGHRFNADQFTHNIAQPLLVFLGVRGLMLDFVGVIFFVNTKQFDYLIVVRGFYRSMVWKPHANFTRCSSSVSQKTEVKFNLWPVTGVSDGHIWTNLS